MELKQEVANLLKKILPLKEIEILNLLENPPNSSLGDISLPCFQLSKLLKKDPKLIALELKEKLKPNKLIKEIKVIGPYLNFFFNNETITTQILTKILKEKEKYGFKKSNKKKVVIEFPSPNTNKPLHLGHLRNMALGESISRIIESQGYKVIRVNLNNDRGIHICKSMLAYKKWGNNKQPNKKSDHFVGDFYVLFAQKSKLNQELEQEALELLRKWEKGDKSTISLWKKMNSWALKGFNETYKRFGLKFNKTYFESKIYKKGKDLVLNAFKQGKFQKDEKGAIIIDLGDLGKKILLREDGTSIYITQDLYLAKLKHNDFKADSYIIVSASEQDHHFKVLFKILELLNFKFAKSCHHLSYGLVLLPEGRMKSREGTVVDADDLIDELTNMAKEELKKRQNNNLNLAEKIALSSLKCHLLKFSTTTNITFNPQESISFQGETGPYLQYSLVRANKILNKSKIKPKLNTSLLKGQEILDLIKLLGEFPLILEKSTKMYTTHYLTEYLFKIASLFNLFYEKYPVISAESKELQASRLALVQAYGITIKSGLSLLGIEEVKEM